MKSRKMLCGAAWCVLFLAGAAGIARGQGSENRRTMAATPAAVDSSSALLRCESRLEDCIAGKKAPGCHPGVPKKCLELLTSEDAPAFCDENNHAHIPSCSPIGVTYTDIACPADKRCTIEKKVNAQGKFIGYGELCKGAGDAISCDKDAQGTVMISSGGKTAPFLDACADDGRTLIKVECVKLQTSYGTAPSSFYKNGLIEYQPIDCSENGGCITEQLPNGKLVGRCAKE